MKGERPCADVGTHHLRRAAAGRRGSRFLPATPWAHGGDVAGQPLRQSGGRGFDLVIRTGYLDDSSLIARHILDSQWVICAAPPMCAASGRRASRQTCSPTTACATPTRARGPRWAFKGKRATICCRCRAAFAPTTPALCARRRWGRGIVYVPRCLVYHDLMNGELVDLFPIR